MLNEYLMELSLEQSDRLYGLLGVLQWPVYVAILIWISAKYQIPAKEKVSLWITFAVSWLWTIEMCPLLSAVTDGLFPKTNLGVGFLLFLMFVASMAYMLKMSVWLSLETLIPAYILGRGLAILGCIFAGCCHGFSCSWGIYSREAETTTFPTVLLDSVASCLIATYLLRLIRRHHYSGNGVAAAVGMILFGILRMVIDILRDNNKLIFLFTIEGLFGILYILLGWTFLRKIHSSEKNEIDTNPKRLC